MSNKEGSYRGKAGNLKGNKVQAGEVRLVQYGGVSFICKFKDFVKKPKKRQSAMVTLVMVTHSHNPT